MANDQLTSFAELTSNQRKRLWEHMILPKSERMELRAHEEEIDLDYQSSKLCLEPDDNLSVGPRAGLRAPDAAPLLLADKTCTLLKALSAPHHHLLLFDASGSGAIELDVLAAAEAAMSDNGHWLKVFVVASGSQQLPTGIRLLVDPHHALRERYGGNVARLYLIRPDGYIAYRSRNVNGLNEYLQRALSS